MRSLTLLRNAAAFQAGGGAWFRLLASASDSEFSGLDMMGDRNVDIFDRALKSKQVVIKLRFHMGFVFTSLLLFAWF
jgi:hypothetical protein